MENTYKSSDLVYFVQQSDSRAIKIGKSTLDGLRGRISDLQVASPFKLNLIGWTRKYTESELHERFNEFRWRGEWFFPHYRLIEFIKKYVDVRNPEVALLEPDIPSARRDPDPALVIVAEVQEPEPDVIPLVEARLEFEERYLVSVMTRACGNVSEAARLSGKYRADFYDLLKKHKLNPKTFKKFFE